MNVIFHAENGIVGIGGKPESPEEVDRDVVDAGGYKATLTPGAAVVDSNVSFGLIRGGHLSATVLGTLEVDQEGNSQLYDTREKGPVRGGAIYLVSGPKMIVAPCIPPTGPQTPKIVKKCNAAVTGVKKVMIVTELR